jgi:hypothetical protein
MKFIDKLHSMADEVVEAVQWPFRKRMIERAAESFVDSAESERLKVETQIVDKERELTKITDENEGRTIFKAIVSLRLELEEVDKIAALAKAEKDKLFAETA